MDEGLGGWGAVGWRQRERDVIGLGGRGIYTGWGG